jgi:hypothetical protein
VTTLEPREFGSAINERATLTLDDGRAFRALVTDVRLESEGGRYTVTASVIIVKDDPNEATRRNRS